jgi:hypothetical protein
MIEKIVMPGRLLGFFELARIMVRGFLLETWVGLG